MKLTDDATPLTDQELEEAAQRGIDHFGATPPHTDLSYYGENGQWWLCEYPERNDRRWFCDLRCNACRVSYLAMMHADPDRKVWGFGLRMTAREAMRVIEVIVGRVERVEPLPRKSLEPVA